MTYPGLQPRIGAVIVDYYTREHTIGLLDDLLCDSVDEIVVVDNSGDPQYANSWGSMPSGVKLALSPVNMGYGAGVNAGAALLSEVDHLLVLNSDLRVAQGTFRQLARELEQRGLGALGPLILDPAGRPQEDAAGRFPPRSLLGRRRPPGLWITGACFLTPLSLYRAVGGFDERFFMYWEDVDYCMTLHSLQRPVAQSDLVHVVHISGASDGRKASRYGRARRGRDVFFRKWRYGWIRRTCLRCASKVKLWCLQVAQR